MACNPCSTTFTSDSAWVEVSAATIAATHQDNPTSRNLKHKTKTDKWNEIQHVARVNGRKNLLRMIHQTLAWASRYHSQTAKHRDINKPCGYLRRLLVFLADPRCPHIKPDSQLPLSFYAPLQCWTGTEALLPPLHTNNKSEAIKEHAPRKRNTVRKHNIPAN